MSDAYFRVYEVTGFERQTMSYISGNRKNAVEMQFSACKANVKREELDQDTKIKVRSSLMKLKSMIREDANKLAKMSGEPETVMKFYEHGEQVSKDPYADLTSDPDAAAKYENWYEPATLVWHWIMSIRHIIPSTKNPGWITGSIRTCPWKSVRRWMRILQSCAA